MLKRCALCICLFCCLLGGCGSAAEPPVDYEAMMRETLNRSFSFRADIQWEEMEASAFVEKGEDGSMQLAFDSPELLEGLSVTLSEEEARIEYRGMEMPLEGTDIPAQSILPVLRQLLFTGGWEGLSVREEEETVTAEGSFYTAAFQIILEKETMEIKEILIPDLDAQIQVSEFEFL